MGIEERGAPDGPYLRTAVEQSPLATAILGPDGRYLLANAAWRALWGLGKDESPGGPNAFEDERLRAMGLTPYLEECARDGGVTTPLLLREATHKTGQRWLRAFVYPVRDRAGLLVQMGLVLEDFTGHKALEDRLVHRAFHDPLTGLPNRALFSDRLAQALSRAGRAGSGEVALLYMDVDDFKRFNDALGHHAGDRLLVGVAERVAGSLRPGDTFARFGGDEFAMLLEGLGGVADAVEVAKRIRRELVPPFGVGGHQAVVTASVGIVMADPGETGEGHAEELMRRADIAMYRGKSGGKDRHEVFSPGMNHSLKRLGLEEELRRAIGSGELRVHYQPQVLLSTGETVGFEALVRWEHPRRGLLGSSEFVPLAEETGMIAPLGRWVLAEACRQASVFGERVPPGAPLTMSVNLSARQFGHPGLAEEVSAAVSEAGLDPGDLVLEVTESAVTEGGPEAAGTLGALRDLGVKLAMDDFGTGHSSIARLGELPMDVLKIDRAMVAGLDGGPEKRAVVSAIVGLAHALGLGVVAEGVETAGELGELRSMGCDAGQGHYWRGPRPAEEAGRPLAARPGLWPERRVEASAPSGRSRPREHGGEQTDGQRPVRPIA